MSQVSYLCKQLNESKALLKKAEGALLIEHGYHHAMSSESESCSICQTLKQLEEFLSDGHETR